MTAPTTPANRRGIGGLTALINRAVGAFIPLTQKGAANGVATLDGASKLTAAQLPSLRLVTVTSVANQAARLALPADDDAQFVVQTDTAVTWMLPGGANPAVNGNWTALPQPSTAGLAQTANNLSDLASAPAARTNLGLGTAATHAATDFPLAANNGSDFADAGSTRANLRVRILGEAQAVATSNVTKTAPGSTFDGVTLSNSGTDVLLLAGQTTGSENGPWIWNGAGSALTRPHDWANGASVTVRTIEVVQGTVYANTFWQCNTTGTITVDTTSTLWAPVNRTYNDTRYVAGLGCQYVPGDYYAPVAVSVTTGTFSADGVLLGGYVIVGRTCTLTKIGVEVTAGGASGSVLRLGIYRFRPGSDTADLLIDAGTVTSTGTGYQELTISQAVNAGDKLLMVVVSQGAPATRPTIRTSSGTVQFAGYSTALTLSQNNISGSQAFSVTGVLPSTHTLNPSTVAPRVLTLAAA